MPHPSVKLPVVVWPSRLQQLEAMFTTGYAVLAILLTMSAMYFLFAERSADLGPGTPQTARTNPLYLLVWMALHVATALLLVKSVLDRGVQPSLLSVCPMLLLVIGSLTWSVAANATLYFGLLLTLTILCAYVLAQIMEPARLLALMAVTIGVLLVVSLVLIPVAPAVVLTSREEGSFVGAMQLHGVFAHKSDAGYYFAILFVLCANARFLPLNVLWRCLICGTAFFGLLLTASATGLIAAFGVTGLVLAIRNAGRWQGRVTTVVTALLIGFAVAIPVLDIGSIVGAVGRDPNLTGRGPIWPAGFSFLVLKPVLGYGYFAFWDLNPYSPAWRLWERFEWFQTPHFHNSALEVSVGLGIVGLVVYLVYLAMAAAVAVNTTIDAEVRLSLVSVLWLLIISSALDFTLLKHNSFATLFMFYCFFAAQRIYSGMNGPAGRPFRA